MWREGRPSQTRMATELNVMPNVNWNLWKQFQDTGSMTSWRRHVRPRSTTTNEERYLVLSARQHMTACCHWKPSFMTYSCPKASWGKAVCHETHCLCITHCSTQQSMFRMVQTIWAYDQIWVEHHDFYRWVEIQPRPWFSAYLYLERVWDTIPTLAHQGTGLLRWWRCNGLVRHYVEQPHTPACVWQRILDCYEVQRGDLRALCLNFQGTC